MTNTLSYRAKRLIKGFFGLFGLRVSRLSKTASLGGAKYFNTGKMTPFEENSRELYDRFYADHTALDEYYSSQRLDLYAAISQHVRENHVMLDDKEVIDVGCGTGHLLAELRKWSKPRSLSGCDFAEEAMKFSFERFPGCHFFSHDIYDPLSNSYDAVLCTEVLEHLERPFTAIRNLVNATRSGGRIIVTVPNGRLDQLNEHINFWSPESWKVFVERECPDCRSVCSTLKNGLYNIAVIQRSK